MLSTLPIWLAPSPPQEREHLTLEAVRTRLAVLVPELPWGSPSCNSAVVLLAAVDLGHNVDRLARFAGLPREAVARCARRLVDNGVWRDGNTVARWVDDDRDAESFVADVAVADGVLCRRMGDDGQPEWAPQGYWRKHYEYVGPREDEQPQVVRYHPHVEMLPQDLPYPFMEDDEDEEAAAATAEPLARRVDDAVTVPEPQDPPMWLGSDEAGGIEDKPWQQSSTVVGNELFPEAVWLA